MKLDVLLATADASLEQTCACFFNACGYEFETVTGGVDCLARLRESLPAVLVLDREISWGSGDGVLAQLREEFSTQPICVVLVTGETCDEAEQIVPPVVQCVRKPIGLQALLEIIEYAAGQSSKKVAASF